MTAELPWSEKNEPLQKMVAALNELYQNEPTLWGLEKESFEWVDIHQNVVAYLRKGKDRKLLCIHNYLPETQEKITLPWKAPKEIFNTDSPQWGGSGILGGKDSISLGPLATHVFEL